MTALSDMILQRAESGRIVDRAVLGTGANYDSVGRALGQLVKQRKLVRVGRGKYRKASSGTTVSLGSIADRMQQRIARSRKNVFLRSDFAELGSYDAVGRALRQIEKKGRLVQIGHGLYAKAERSPLTGKPAPLVGIRKLATEALGRLGKTVAASTFDTAYKSGKSTQVPTGRTLRVKERVKRRIGYDGNYVVLERA
jgi:uncharacterized protein DUF6088